jgi:hypothetical protein
MGFVFSCCRRRRKADRGDDDDTEPLLYDQAGSQRKREPYTFARRIAQIIGALKAGKLPSQEQINRAMQLFLASEPLRRIEDTSSTSEYVPSEQARRVMLCTKETLQKFAQFGLEKNCK